VPVCTIFLRTFFLLPVADADDDDEHSLPSLLLLLLLDTFLANTGLDPSSLPLGKSFGDVHFNRRVFCSVDDKPEDKDEEDGDGDINAILQPPSFLGTRLFLRWDELGTVPAQCVSVIIQQTVSSLSQQLSSGLCGYMHCSEHK
jgi:hypothetical protein